MMLSMGLIIGFTAGAVICWLWLQGGSKTEPFQAVLNGIVNGRSPRDEAYEKIQQRLQELEQQIAELRQKIKVPEAQQPPAAPAAVTVLPARSRRETNFSPGRRKERLRNEILNRWRQGQKALEIARDTGLGQGEVELILALRGGAARAGGGERNAGFVYSNWSYAGAAIPAGGHQ